MTLQNEKFEELLSRQLTGQLDGQRGRARAAFTAQIAAEAAQRAAEERAARIAGGSKNKASWARREVSGWGLWVWMGVPSLAAAALAVAVTLHYTGQATRPTAPDIRMVTNVPDAPPEIKGGVNVMEGATLARQVDITQTPPRGVVIVNRVLIQDIPQPTYPPSQYIDPVAHAYSFAVPPSEQNMPTFLPPH